MASDAPQTLAFRRRNLPHWYVADRPCFVTFRLKGTLPRHVTEEYKQAMERLIDSNANRAAILATQRRHFTRIEKILDAAEMGARYLERPDVAALVIGAFDWLDRERGWDTHATVVMPNHVHCCLRNRSGRSAKLADDIGSLKKFVALRANRILGRSGSLWQSENFDHWCRGSSKIEGSVVYIRDNPVKAGLVTRAEDWPWLRIDRERFPHLCS